MDNLLFTEVQRQQHPARREKILSHSAPFLEELFFVSLAHPALAKQRRCADGAVEGRRKQIKEWKIF
jgi:hypothetical protein